MDRYLLPFSEAELCQICLQDDNFDDAKKHLEGALSYKGYSMEARLHFRLQAMTSQIKARKGPKTESVDSTIFLSFMDRKSPGNEVTDIEAAMKNTFELDSTYLCGSDQIGGDLETNSSEESLSELLDLL